MEESRGDRMNHRRKEIGFLLLLIGMLFVGCAEKKQAGEYQQIEQKEAKELMDTESDYIILDVRTEEEYAQEHIAGAICLPNESIDEDAVEVLTDKDQMILVYCRSGNRSKQAAQKLVDLGYTDIREFGGITTWEYETEK